jgi:GNAT superfamily N-acetyltransferase
MDVYRHAWDESYSPGPEDYSGSPAQRELQSRAYDLWRRLRHDPRYVYDGRVIAINGVNPDSIDDLIFLAHAQGAALVWYLPRDDAPSIVETLHDRGLVAECRDQYLGAGDAVRAAAHVRDSRGLPEGYALGVIDALTPQNLVVEFADLGAEHGVMVPAAHVLRGLTRPCAAMYASGPDGRIAAIAGAVLGHHRNSALASSAWAGPVCTHRDHRGRGLATILGALTLLELAERCDARSFYAAVRHDCPASVAVCERLGLHRTAYSVMTIVSPDASGNGTIVQ